MPKTKKHLAEITEIYRRREDVRAFTNLFLTLFVVTVFSVFAIKPTVTTVIALNKQINEKRQTLSGLDEKIRSLEAAQALWEKNGDDIALLNQAVPREPRLGEQIRQIEGVVQKNNVSLGNMEVEDVRILGKSAEGGEKLISFNLNVSGQFGNLLLFLRDIENTRRPFVVTAALVSQEVGESGDELLINIKGESPYYEE